MHKTTYILHRLNHPAGLLNKGGKENSSFSGYWEIAKSTRAERKVQALCVSQQQQQRQQQFSGVQKCLANGLKECQIYIKKESREKTVVAQSSYWNIGCRISSSSNRATVSRSSFGCVLMCSTRANACTFCNWSYIQRAEYSFMHEGLLTAPNYLYFGADQPMKKSSGLIKQ